MDDPRSSSVTRQADEDAEYEYFQKAKTKMLRKQARRELRQRKLNGRPKVHSFAALVRKGKQHRLHGKAVRSDVAGATEDVGMAEAQEVETLDEMAKEVNGSSEEGDSQADVNNQEAEPDNEVVEVSEEGVEANDEGVGVNDEEVDVNDEEVDVNDEKVETPRCVEGVKDGKNVEVTVPDGTVLVRVSKCVFFPSFANITNSI